MRFLSSFLGGLGAGFCVRIFYKDRSYFNFTGFSEASSRDTDQNPAMRFLKNLGALKIVLGAKRFVLYLAYVILISVVIGLTVDRIL